MAGRYDTTIRQGETWERRLTWKDANGAIVDLTGWDARLQARKNITDANPVIDLTVGSGITLLTGQVADHIKLRLEDTETAILSFVKAVWDLEMIAPGGDVTRLLEGCFSLSKEVTR